jgi:deazaflavin-dependent oxidoreductase (nitroreductase family)
MPEMYKRPSFLVAKVANPLVNLLIRLGLRPSGAHTLIVTGRKSGKPRPTPVNPLDYDGRRYLVAPRGTTEWVLNLRAAGGARLRGGRKTWEFTATEVPVEDRPQIIRAYLERWGTVTAGQFGVAKDASVEQLRDIAADHPVFEIFEQPGLNAP